MYGDRQSRWIFLIKRPELVTAADRALRLCSMMLINPVMSEARRLVDVHSTRWLAL